MMEKKFSRNDLQHLDLSHEKDSPHTIVFHNDKIYRYTLSWEDEHKVQSLIADCINENPERLMLVPSPLKHSRLKREFNIRLYRFLVWLGYYSLRERNQAA